MKTEGSNKDTYSEKNSEAFVCTDSCIPVTALFEKLSSFLNQDGRVKLAMLFGSGAENKLRSESDIDIALTMGQTMSSQEQSFFIEQIAQATGRAVDLLDLEMAHGLILKQVFVQGIELVPSDPRTKERLLKRMIYEQEDLAPQIQKAKKDRVYAFAHGH